MFFWNNKINGNKLGEIRGNQFKSLEFLINKKPRAIALGYMLVCLFIRYHPSPLLPGGGDNAGCISLPFREGLGVGSLTHRR